MDNIEGETSEEKKPMTNEERIALSEKLDKELDDFIAGLERKAYTEGWPEDKWEEEMEKHPFFMTKTPENGELPPLLHGIQQLKYDETENTPLELATSYKEDGNFNFKCKKYRMAILSYTEGIRRKCGDAVIEAQLYSNRAAAQIHLGNYRSALGDCKQALKIDPDYVKAKVKAAECCVETKLFDDAIAYCDDILQDRPTEHNALEIRANAVKLKKIEERDKRKEGVKNAKLKSGLQLVEAAIKLRNIRCYLKEDMIDALESADHRPTLVCDKLHWPVFFLYPEFSTSDFIEEFHEDSIFEDHLQEMFATPPSWDKIAEYKPEYLNVYFEANPSTLCKVDVKSSLGQILANGKLLVRDWTPSFFIFVKNSPSEKNFIKSYSVVQ